MGKQIIDIEQAIEFMKQHHGNRPWWHFGVLYFEHPMMVKDILAEKGFGEKYPRDYFTI
jgi:(p)ppGpp synthase/HD superfamily hydrolase